MMSQALPRASVILCTLNGREYIEGAVRSLFGQSLAPDRFEVIVVDNGSTDGSLEIVEGLAGERPDLLRLIHEPVPGVCRARNRGIRAARGEVMVFLDDDARAEPDWLEALIPALEEPSVGAAGGPIGIEWRDPPPAWWRPEFDSSQARLDYGPERKFLSLPLVLYESNLAVTREAFTRIGLFREELGRVKKHLGAGAGYDLAIRLFRAGYGMIYEPSARVRHLGLARRSLPEFMRRKSYWHSRSRRLIEAINGVEPSPILLHQLMDLVKDGRDLMLKGPADLVSQRRLASHWGYLRQHLEVTVRPPAFPEPPPLTG